MAELTFNTTAGQTIDREMYLMCLNTGTSEVPVWSPLGRRTPESNAEYDWGGETSRDILGKVRTNMDKPVINQTFDPLPLDSGDPAIVKLWNLAVKDQNAAALGAMDILIVHLYAGTANTAVFAERYTGSAIRNSGLGGPGNGNNSMPIQVTPGGDRITGTAAVSNGVITFTPDAA